MINFSDDNKAIALCLWMALWHLIHATVSLSYGYAAAYTDHTVVKSQEALEIVCAINILVLAGTTFFCNTAKPNIRGYKIIIFCVHPIAIFILEIMTAQLDRDLIRKLMSSTFLRSRSRPTHVMALALTHWFISVISRAALFMNMFLCFCNNLDTLLE